MLGLSHEVPFVYRLCSRCPGCVARGFLFRGDAGLAHAHNVFASWFDSMPRYFAVRPKFYTSFVYSKGET